MGTVRELTKADTEAAAASLGDAFADDPVFGWLGGFTDDAGRMTIQFRQAIRGGFRKPTPLMFTTESNDAASIWAAPGESDVGLVEVLRSLPAWLRTYRTGVLRTFGALQAIEKVHPKEEHYYLFAVGVRRNRQGSGLGSEVIAPMLDRCDAEGLPAYLENSKPKNEAFYVRHGFAPLEPVHLGEGAPPMTPMWREPR